MLAEVGTHAVAPRTGRLTTVISTGPVDKPPWRRRRRTFERGVLSLSGFCGSSFMRTSLAIHRPIRLKRDRVCDDDAKRPISRTSTVLPDTRSEQNVPRVS